MRADRLLSLVLLLQRHRHLTARELAESLGVTERTIYRDIDALSMAGVPVYTRSGPDGGCFLDEQYRSSLNWFTGAELQTLLYAGSAAPLSALGMQQAMDDAILKLLALLPGRHQREAEAMRQRLYLDPSGWYGTTESHPSLPLLKEAVWTDTVIEADYENWDGERQRRTLAPYSLVYKADRWYLVARSQRSGTVRTYRVSRLTDVTLGDAQFERDPGFDIAAYWADAAAQFMSRLPGYPVTLRARPAAMIYFRSALAGRYDVLDENADWLLLRVHYTVFEEARSSVLGLGTEAEVVEPTALHTAVVAQARAIAAKYAGDG